MGLEIEKKYLVVDNSYKKLATSNIEIRQGYLSRVTERTVRIRIYGEEGKLTVKGKTEGMTREEFEYSIPLSDARLMMRLCEGPIVEKTRWIVPYEGFIWEIDEFHGQHEGLTLAEVELKSATENPFLPPFIGLEVTGDARYYNSRL